MSAPSNESRPGVAFLWHMHQPLYRWPGRPHFVLPWVRLHAAKAYCDMAWMLEQHPDIRATVNFSGVLIRQIREYLEEDRRDDFWFLTLRDPGSLADEERAFVVDQFFSCHWDRLVHPHPRYAELLRLRQTLGWKAFGPAELGDLQALFNLQWCGQWLRATHPVVSQLAKKERYFTQHDREALLEAHMDALRSLSGRWGALAASGQVEICTTPMFHPILPLVVDTASARRCLPDHPLPSRFSAPGDARLHVDLALAEVESWLGHRPVGMWPAEGSVSPEAVQIFADAGVSWIASDEEVLRRSRTEAPRAHAPHLQPWRLTEVPNAPAMVFRDHGISDAIGFSYAQQPAAMAAEDFVRRIRARLDGAAPDGTVFVVLDGENPWEAYPEDGIPFLRALYRQLAGAGGVPTRTVGSAAQACAGAVHALHSGSWINADFRIWIGVPAKNRGWELLRMAREWANAREQAGLPLPQRAHQALLAAEGSDWFWWYGDDFASDQKAQFDEIFRRLCAAVWAECGAEPPSEIWDANQTSPGPLALQLPTRPIAPRVDGRVTDFFEWHGAGVFHVGSGAGAMYRANRLVCRVLFGYGDAELFLRLDADLGEAPVERVVVTAWSEDGQAQGPWELSRGVPPGEQGGGQPRGAVDDIVEISLPWASLQAREGSVVGLVLVVTSARGDVERIPSTGRLELRLGERAWSDWIV